MKGKRSNFMIFILLAVFSLACEEETVERDKDQVRVEDAGMKLNIHHSLYH